MKMFLIYDSKAEIYHNPLFNRTSQEGIRQFQTIANDKNTTIGMYPGDFTLFEVGEFDPATGNTSLYEAKKSLGLAQDFVKKGE